MLKKIRYFVEGFFVITSYWLFRILPLPIASAVGGYCGRLCGPLLPRTKLARNNIRTAMPELDEAAIDRIIYEMWDNLGRVFAEFPHVGRLDRNNFDAITEIQGMEHIENAKKNGKGNIFFSGHLANWEMSPKALAMCDCPLAIVYRTGNNPIIDKIIQQTRNYYQSESIPKGPAGSRQLIRLLRQGSHIGMLVDQKMNDGIEVDFFGRGAMSAPAIVNLALKFNCSVIPVQIIRVKGATFKVSIFPPLEISKSNNEQTDVSGIMTEINAILESWIRENPAQWIWIHNRWPKDDESKDGKTTQ